MVEKDKIQSPGVWSADRCWWIRRGLGCTPYSGEGSLELRGRSQRGLGRSAGDYSQGHNIFNIYPEHFAFFAVHDFGHRKERKVRKDSLNCLVLDYKLLFLN